MIKYQYYVKDLGFRSEDLTTAGSVPFARRKDTDRIYRDGESYKRYEIDRSIKLVDFVFSVLIHPYGKEIHHVIKVKPWEHPENSPSQVASRIVEATGRVAIADIGCGTGNTLVSWGQRIADVTKCKLGDISMTGLTRQDYSTESIHAGTLRALRGNHPLLRYLVGDAEHMTDIESDSQDVVLAYNSIIHADHPELWLAEMLRIARPGGSILFNCTFEQAAYNKPVPNFIEKLHSDGYPVLRDHFMEPDFGPNTPSVVSQMILGLTYNTSLYRIDIPR